MEFSLAGVVLSPRLAVFTWWWKDVWGIFLIIELLGSTRLVSSKERSYYSSLLLSAGSRLLAHLWNQVIIHSCHYFAVIRVSLFFQRYIPTKQSKQEGFANKEILKKWYKYTTRFLSVGMHLIVLKICNCFAPVSLNDRLFFLLSWESKNKISIHNLWKTFYHI